MTAPQPPGRPSSGRRLRVAYVNNYKTELARIGHANGDYPAHHLWGALELEAVADVERWTLPRPALRRGALLGPLAQQVAPLRSRPDVVYSGNLGGSLGLSLADSVLPGGPGLVSVCHGGSSAGLYGRALRRALLKADVTIALADRRAEELAALAPGARIEVVRWGPDLAFAPFREIAARPAGPGRLTALGKTDRDRATLVAALDLLHRRGRTVAATMPADASLAVPPGVTTFVDAKAPADAPASYRAVLPHLAAAQVVAIPLARPQPYVGMTELLDAMACGLPVVHTRSPYVDIDVEAIGCGTSVAEGDVDAWADAIDALMADPDAAHAAGARGRRWLEEDCSSERFGRRLAELVTETR